MAFEIIKREAFKFSPGIDTGIAFATLIMMIPVYYLNANFGYEKPVFFFVGFLGVGHILLNTLIPAFTVFVLCREGWNGLGFTKRRIILSLVLSILKSLSGNLYLSMVGYSFALKKHLALLLRLFWRAQRSLPITSGLFLLKA